MGLYNELHRDFALRTRANLEHIDAAWAAQEKAGNERTVFNVTQLINSCLGMVVFIKESQYLPAGSIQDFCPEIDFETLQDERNSNDSLQQFIRRFRNAISHCHIEAYGNAGDIVGFRLWDGPPNGEINWKIEMGTDSIRALADALVNHVLENAPQG
ncbi:HEPN family nuclease [Maridesulfovibrio sp.]|uniref:HEPN family nuclease n=1 Tax=Maridesulfovibrio sp. TaxID=2795000 RepID=UPI0029CA1058|nr:HEPN family nuclease [Maridesulfovibrio sp.]